MTPCSPARRWDICSCFPWKQMWYHNHDLVSAFLCLLWQKFWWSWTGNLKKWIFMDRSSDLTLKFVHDKGVRQSAPCINITWGILGFVSACWTYIFVFLSTVWPWILDHTITPAQSPKGNVRTLWCFGKSIGASSKDLDLLSKLEHSFHRIQLSMTRSQPMLTRFFGRPAPHTEVLPI
jgi:hypothetical protein